MAAIHLHCTSDVGTTYKRALKRIHLSRDDVVPACFTLFCLIDKLAKWRILIMIFEGDLMRKLRDYDAELKALDDKAKDLRLRRLRQLGELVIATGADALPIEELAGTLLGAVDSKDGRQREAWRRRGATFFQRPARGSSASAGTGARSSEAADSGTLPFEPGEVKA